MSTSFEKFHDTTYMRAFRFANKLTHNSDDAADLTQESYLRAYAGYERRDPLACAEAWLMQIIYNVFLDSCRRKKRAPKTVSTVELNEVNPTFEAVDIQPNPEEVLLDNTLSEPFDAALHRISAADRALILFSLGGASLQAIARVFGCSVTRVKSRMKRAQVALKRQLVLADGA